MNARLNFVTLFAVALVFGTAANAATTYKTVDYNDEATFVQALTTLGGQGFELINCIDTGSAQYTAFGTDSTGQSVTYNGMLIDRTSYCVLKQTTSTFQYQTWDYTTQSAFVTELATMSNQGYELASCVTTGAVGYSASGSGFLNDLQLARTSYCVFKK